MLDRLAVKSQAAEVYTTRSQLLTLEFQGQELHVVKEDDRFARAARAIVDGRLGFAATTDASGSGPPDRS